MKASASHDYRPDQSQESELKGSNEIIVFHLGRPLSVKARDITYLEGVGNYTFVCTKTNRYLIAKCLKYVQGLLNPDFVRVHKTYSVNRNQIERRWIDSLQMQCGKHIPIARRRMSSTHEALSASVISPSSF